MMTRASHRYFRSFWWLLPTSLVAVAWILLFWGGGALYFGPADSDLVNYFYPIRAFVHRWLMRGVMPYWDPHAFSGYPVVESQQMALFYPISLGTALLPPGLGLSAITAIHLALAVGGFWFFLRRGLRSSAPAAALGSVVYGFGTFFAVRVAAGHVTAVGAMAWWPWALLGTLNTARLAAGKSIPWRKLLTGGRKEWRILLSDRGFWKAILPWLLLASAANAMVVLVGAPQYVVYLGWMQLAACAVVAVRKQWILAVVSMALSWLAALVLSAPQWLPSLWYLPYTGRANAPTGVGRTGASDVVSFFLELVFPYPLGDDMRLPHLHRQNVWEIATYPGAVALVLVAALALRAFGSLRRPRQVRPAGGARPWRTVRRWLPLVLIGLGLYLLLGLWVPGFGSFRGALKARAIVAFAFAAGAAAGLDEMRIAQRFRQRAGSRRRLGFVPEVAVALVLAAGALAAVVGLSAEPDFFARMVLSLGPPLDPNASPFYERASASPELAVRQLRLSAALVAIIAAGLAGAVFLLGRRPAAGLVALVLIGGLEPAAINLYTFWSRHSYENYNLPPVLAAWFERKAETSRRAGELPWRVSLPPNLMNRNHLLDGFLEVGGYDPLMPHQAMNRHVLVDGERDLPSPDKSERATRMRHTAIGRRYDLQVWQAKRDVPPLSDDAAFPETAKEAELIAVARKLRPGAPVNGYGPAMDGTHYVAPSEKGGSSVEAEELPEDFRKLIGEITESGEKAGLAEGQGEEILQQLPGESLRLLPRNTPNEYTVEAKLRVPGLVLLRMTWLPGWNVRIDEGPAEKPLVANKWNPAVMVPAGEHRVTFFYRPVGLAAARVMAAAGGAVLLGLLLWARRKAAD